jgi:hypothetical protein
VVGHRRSCMAGPVAGSLRVEILMQSSGRSQDQRALA